MKVIQKIWEGNAIQELIEFDLILVIVRLTRVKPVSVK